MASIRSLRPNVSREEALQQFSGGTLAFLRETAFGPLHAVADFYIPFQLFRVEISNSGKRHQEILGIDGINGSLDPYRFEQLPAADEILCLETRNTPPALLDPESARQLVVTKVQRVLFTTGFFRMRALHISAEPLPGEICVPYWVGFRGKGRVARFSVLDAVRRQVEGSRVKVLLQNWLTAHAENLP
jgi:hypothetical protein